MTTICFVNQKGGVGKTTSAVNIGAGLAKLAKRVLLIDLDPQESLSYWLGVTDPDKTIFDFFDGKVSLASCVTRHAGGFDVIPSNEMLATITPDVYQLKQALDKMDYDFVLLDCSPTLGMMALAALTAAQWVIVPLCPDLLSVKGMSQLLGTIQTIREQTNPDIVLKGVIATRYDSGQKMHSEVLEQVDAFLDGAPVYTVREDIAVAESPVAGMSVLDYKPDSTGAQDYMAIARGLVAGKQGFKTAVAELLVSPSSKAEDSAPKQATDKTGLSASPPAAQPLPEAKIAPAKSSDTQGRTESAGLKAALLLGLIVAATAIMVLLVQAGSDRREAVAQQAIARQPAVQEPAVQESAVQVPIAVVPPPAVKPAKTVLKGVQFDYDKDTLQSQSYPILNEIVDVAKQNPEWKFRLTGHTDSWGDDAYNLALSLRRVQAVKRYLISQGVADGRLTVVGKGRSERITTNDTVEGRAQNRRVELEVE